MIPKVKIGTDICKIKRIRSVYEKYGSRFLNRVLTEEEKKYVTSNERMLIPRLAGRFASKEALSKLLGTGLRGVYFKELEILREPSGKPKVVLHKRALEKANKDKLVNFEISISHEEDFAVAFVVAVQDTALSSQDSEN